jgi:hypothetical protein
MTEPSWQRDRRVNRTTLTKPTRLLTASHVFHRALPVHDPRSHQIEAEIADTGRVQDQGDDNYRGMEATNPKINQQK